MRILLDRYKRCLRLVGALQVVLISYIKHLRNLDVLLGRCQELIKSMVLDLFWLCLGYMHRIFYSLFKLPIRLHIWRQQALFIWFLWRLIICLFSRAWFRIMTAPMMIHINHCWLIFSISLRRHVDILRLFDVFVALRRLFLLRPSNAHHRIVVICDLVAPLINLYLIIFLIHINDLSKKSLKRLEPSSKNGA